MLLIHWISPIWTNEVEIKSTLKPIREIVRRLLCEKKPSNSICWWSLGIPPSRFFSTVSRPMALITSTLSLHFSSFSCQFTLILCKFFLFDAFIGFVCELNSTRTFAKLSIVRMLVNLVWNILNAIAGRSPTLKSHKTIHAPQFAMGFRIFLLHWFAVFFFLDIRA